MCKLPDGTIRKQRANDYYDDFIQALNSKYPNYLREGNNVYFDSVLFYYERKIPIEDAILAFIVARDY